MEKELWTEIEGFVDYAVSNFGRVMNLNTDLIKTPTPNQQGIPSVLLMHERVQYRRAVALLVAHHFVPMRQPHFNTPINLDGDRFNNHWQNLVWRPRWFATRYHSQFKRPPAYGFRGGVYVVEENLTFDDVRTCAQYYGLLEKEIIMSTHTQQPVFPTWHTFGAVANAV